MSFGTKSELATSLSVLSSNHFQKTYDFPTYHDIVYNSGGVPGLLGTIDDEIDPQNMVFSEYKSNEGSLFE